MKQTSSQPDLITLSVRVPRATADVLKAIAAREYRSVGAEIRRLVEERVDNDSEPERAAA